MRRHYNFIIIGAVFLSLFIIGATIVILKLESKLPIRKTNCMPNKLGRS